MGVAVLVRLMTNKQAPTVEFVDDGQVGVFDKGARPRGHAVVEGAIGSHRVEHRQCVQPSDAGVVLAEGRSQMDDPGAVSGAHEVVDHQLPGVGSRCRVGIEHVVGAGVTHALHVATRPSVQWGTVESVRYQCLGQHQVTTGDPEGGGRHPHVGDVRPNGRSDV